MHASAAGLLAPELGLLADMLWRLREFGLELVEGRAGGFLLPELGERHAELEQRIGGLLALLVFLVAMEEGVGGVLILTAHIIALSDPILCVAGKRIVRIGVDQLAESVLGACIVLLEQRTI